VILKKIKKKVLTLKTRSVILPNVVEIINLDNQTVKLAIISQSNSANADLSRVLVVG
jgi:hypothetical protein